jgi:hypothetical protein
MWNYCNGDGVAALHDVGWFSESKPDYQNGSATHRVASLEPNAIGLYDMHGNVMEWTIDDAFDFAYRTRTDSVLDPEYAKFGRAFRVVKGGAYLSDPIDCRAASKYTMRPKDSESYIGFRVGLFSDSTCDRGSRSLIYNPDMYLGMYQLVHFGSWQLLSKFEKSDMKIRYEFATKCFEGAIRTLKVDSENLANIQELAMSHYGLFECYRVLQQSDRAVDSLRSCLNILEYLAGSGWPTMRENFYVDKWLKDTHHLFHSSQCDARSFLNSKSSLLPQLM